METGITKEPLVSVIIPAYNCRNYISETLKSVFDQTYPNIEVILVDDGSTDQTLEIVAQHFSDPRLKILSQANKGAAAARNAGYRQSAGDHIKFMDSDDLINSEMIEQQVSLATANSNCVVSSAWGRFYHNDVHTFAPNPEPCWRTMKALDWICSSWQNTASMTTPGIFLIPRKIVERAGLWDESLSLLDDTEYFTRTILAAEQVVFSPGSTLYYRSGLANSLSALQTYAAWESAYSAYEKTISMILKTKNNKETSLLCANIWQLFIYNTYDNYRELTEKAEFHLRGLEKPSIPFPCGLYTGLFVKLIGWKATKRLRRKIDELLEEPEVSGIS